MKFDLKVDMRPLGKALNNISGALRREGLSKATLAGLFTLEAHAKLNVKKNFKQRTGFLGANWETLIDKSSTHSVLGHTSPLAIYARIQELGGVIRATNAGSLRFQTDDGVWHSVKAVTIPARPFLRPAADENQKDIFGAVAIVLHEFITGSHRG